MTTKASYFRIGLFVIGATAVCVAAVIVLGAGAFFRRTIPMETYFEESVQGLEVGSPVKYRGVMIGSVSRIGFAQQKYQAHLPPHRALRHILVEMNLYEDALDLEDPSDSVLEKQLQQWTDLGLRCQLRSQGITGMCYLELDEFDPRAHPPIEIDWTPQRHYVPATTSTIARVTDSFDSISKTLRQIEQADIVGIADKLEGLLQATTQAVQSADLRTISDEAASVFKEVRQTSGQLRAILERPEISRLLEDAAAATASARRILENAEGKADEVLNRLAAAAGNLDNVAKKLDALLDEEALSKTLGNLSGASQKANATLSELPETVAELRAAVRRVNRLLDMTRGEIAEILLNVRAASENVRDLTDDARQHPSGTLFGNPPPVPEPME